MTHLLLIFSFGTMLFTVTCLYRWFLMPFLNRLPTALALQYLMIVHCFRFISPISLVEGVTKPGLSLEFIYPQVLGDIGAAAFALIAIHMLRREGRFAIPWTWFAHLFGLLYLTLIGVQGFRFDFAEHMGGMFYVVVWFVPWLLLSHIVSLARLAHIAHAKARPRPETKSLL